MLSRASLLPKSVARRGFTSRRHASTKVGHHTLAVGHRLTRRADHPRSPPGGHSREASSLEAVGS